MIMIIHTHIYLTVTTFLLPILNIFTHVELSHGFCVPAIGIGVDRVLDAGQP